MSSVPKRDDIVSIVDALATSRGLEKKPRARFVANSLRVMQPFLSHMKSSVPAAPSLHRATVANAYFDGQAAGPKRRRRAHPMCERPCRRKKSKKTKTKKRKTKKRKTKKCKTKKSKKAKKTKKAKKSKSSKTKKRKCKKR